MARGLGCAGLAKMVGIAKPQKYGHTLSRLIYRLSKLPEDAVPVWCCVMG